jgi:hypothetical protein
MLPHGDIFPLGIVLWAIAHLLKCIRHVGINIVTTYLYPTSGSCFFGDDNSHGRGFASTVVT